MIEVGIAAQAEPATTRITAAALVKQVGSDAQPATPLEQAWIDTEDANRKLRRPLAFWVVGIATGQLVVMNVCLILIGAGVLTFPDTELFHWYMGETFGALLGVAWVIFKYLFPTRKPAD